MGFFSRSAQVGGPALHRAATALIDLVRERAARLWRLPVGEVVWSGGLCVTNAERGLKCRRELLDAVLRKRWRILGPSVSPCAGRH
ncbi:hypothetical protein ABZ260_16780 [Streptosporangium sp. NPDC006013]|uniref:hypothetical protein n=1 Tax=Streptosporangium sp. NPDC006013 TaxID=3155596 RepID=UPI0033BEF284